jgi:hypothetical protein
MVDTFQSILIGGIAGVVSSALTYFSTRAKIRLDLAAEYDKALQENRLAAYLKLWARLEPLARYGRDKPITHKVLEDISTQTRTWYFQAGGIYLTQASRKTYFDWKALLQPLLDDKELEAQSDREINPAVDDRLAKVIAAGSRLRTSLSDDIGTKRLSRL